MKHEHSWPAIGSGPDGATICSACGARWDPHTGAVFDVHGQETSPTLCPESVPMPRLRPAPNARAALLAQLTKAIDITLTQPIPDELKMDVRFMAQQRHQRQQLERIRTFALQLVALRAERGAPIPLPTEASPDVTVHTLAARDHMAQSSDAVCDALALMFTAISHAQLANVRTEPLDYVMNGLVEALIAFAGYLVMAQDAEGPKGVQAAIFTLTGTLDVDNVPPEPKPEPRPKSL